LTHRRKDSKTGEEDREMEKIAALGLGLIGGSLALALRATGLAEQLAGYDANLAMTRYALERGAITLACTTPEEAAREADLVVLATPVLAMRGLLARIAPVLKRGALVTDTASTKARVVAWAEALLPPHAAFVGGHPMAGRETSGIEAADARLFDGCVYCLTPTIGVASESMVMLSEIVERLGAHPVTLDAEQHDHYVAGISHLPFVLSTALAQTLGERQDWPEMARLAASGYRDTTRLAAGSPAMYRDICSTNKGAMLEMLDSLTAQLGIVRSLIEHCDESGGTSDELLDYFARAREVRAAAVSRID
jgi:prephenate dehydrogenase